MLFACSVGESHMIVVLNFCLLIGVSVYVSPASWEERRTASGRIQYLNHITRTTQWDRPTR